MKIVTANVNRLDTALEQHNGLWISEAIKEILNKVRYMYL